jgi:photosystem II stability/assembly factor-like uncharacterized protein
MKFNVPIFLTLLFAATILTVINLPREHSLVSAEENVEDSEGGFNGPSEFEAYHRSIRTPEGASGPQYVAGQIMREFQKATLAAQLRSRSGARSKSNGVIEWKERGPNNVPGRTRGLIVDPDDPAKNTWYAGSVGGGVWKTTDGGQNWTIITPDLPNLATTVLAMAPSNPNTIYLGTGEGFGNVDRIRGMGMFKSTDRGQTWNYLSSTNIFSDVNRAIVDPNNENIVVVATNNGIYRTTNGGTNWTKVSDRFPIQDLKATPGNFAVQYASQRFLGVIKSIDGGQTWFQSNAGMDVSSRVEIAVSPVKTDRIFASAEGELSGTESDLYVSDNAGETWALIDVSFDAKPVDFLGGQGWYDNAIACDPFFANVVYFGGVNLFRVELTSGSTATASYFLLESLTESFMTLVNFVSASNGNFQVGASANNTSVEVRFGPGKSQKAHRFLVPEGATAGVPDESYSYADYVTVPYEVWDVTNNKQLMVSFRDQGRDGQFNLKQANTDGPSLEQAREYIYINNVNYNEAAPSSAIATTGGHIHNQMYFFWPVLAAGKTWPDDIVESKLRFTFLSRQTLNATTIVSSDAYNQFDGKNRFVDYGNDFHPDQHGIIMIPMSPNTYKILISNDGGVFVSNTSSNPGITQGDWLMRGMTFNTTQFYGADKRPGFEEYVGGTQDNGTWKSPANSIASSSTNYLFNIGGDGFEVIWHNLDDKKIIGGSQGNAFRRSIDGGSTWTTARTGLSGTHPFISKLANSRDNPERIYTLSSDGVFWSANFGETWNRTSITSNWGSATSLMDVEVSRANANIVWAGSGMTETRKLHVSVNAGLSFSETNNTSLLSGGISKLASHPFQENTAYALFSFSGRPKVLRTTNLGQTWQDITGFGTGTVSTNGFPDVAVYCLYVRPDNPDIIWVGTEIGIVESLDNGQTWALIDDFPNVSVWDMKGQDDQVVIATHGRGIWTAKIEAPQISIVTPEIIAFGTSPKKELKLKLKITESFDKIELYVDGTIVKTLTAVTPSEQQITLKNIAAGNRIIKMISYRGTAPYHSKNYTVEQLNIQSVEEAYATYFGNANDLSLKGMLLQPIAGSSPGERSVLQTQHPYGNRANLTTTVLHPIKISVTNPILQYEDIAIVEPGVAGSVFGSADFKDYVVVEASKNGLDWIALAGGYDARYDATWLTTYTAGTGGTKSMFVDHEINLSNSFTAQDTVLIRFRLFSDASTSGWGWAINYVLVQQGPTSVETSKASQKEMSIFPNPSKDNVTFEYELLRPSEVELSITDISGRTAMQQRLGFKQAGVHRHKATISTLGPGQYAVVLKTSTGEMVGKLIVVQ